MGGEKKRETEIHSDWAHVHEQLKRDEFAQITKDQKHSTQCAMEAVNGRLRYDDYRRINIAVCFVHNNEFYDSWFDFEKRKLVDAHK
jgi:hypothetical protein